MKHAPWTMGTVRLSLDSGQRTGGGWTAGWVNIGTGAKIRQEKVAL